VFSRVCICSGGIIYVSRQLFSMGVIVCSVVDRGTDHSCSVGLLACAGGILYVPSKVFSCSNTDSLTIDRVSLF